jgi:hypothetical protein
VPDEQAQILARLAEIADARDERDPLIVKGKAAGITPYRMAKTLRLSANTVAEVLKKHQQEES